ncbi:hypothetical protein ACFW5M_33830 [Streptomyces albogriseolus]|uniref:hypothetical protein n=1 Tax=Streptomyces albogriseolus TaxID=1887 RepID=UPI0036B7A3AD
MVNALGEIKVNRLQVSYIATRIHHDVCRELKEPGSFVTRLCKPQPVRGLEVTLPFEVPVNQREDVAWQLWSKVARRPDLRPPSELGDISKQRDEGDRLRKRLVPLRHRMRLSAPGSATPPFLERQSAEAFLHPFGWVVLSTVDVAWPKAESVSLEEAVNQLAEWENQPAWVAIGNTQHKTTLANAQEDAADILARKLADKGTPWSPDCGHRVATVIDAPDPIEFPADMPPPGGPLHQALHKLSWGKGTALKPGEAFVAHYSDGEFRWIPSDLVYMCGVGTAIFLPEAIANYSHTKKRALALQEETTSTRHRRMTLLITYLSAAAGLVQSAPDRESHGDVADWASRAAGYLSDLFAPKPAAAHFWGLETRRFLERTGGKWDVEDLLYGTLTVRRESPPYPS